MELADYTEEELKGLLDSGVEVARIAGKEIRDVFYKTKATETKEHNADLVTETDKLVEDIIIKSLKEKYPTHSFIGEESTAASGKRTLTTNPTWIIDPIDGTTNFVHSYPYCVVSIGLTIGTQLAVGIIYNPMLEELYTATKGGGAFCNGKRIHVSGQEDIRKCLVAATVSRRGLEGKLSSLKNLVQAEIHGTRNTGSAAANLCLVANGSIDVMYDYGLHSWDIAAGVLIVEEAGGVVLDPSSLAPIDLLARRLLAASSMKLAQTVGPLLVHVDFPRD
ncbi:inositol monophosphatase 1-like [Amphiura filiformis]|uniref:inositol monophosphatase 1-like n=1 Tax=Amphiura filiformis TaxID=82378 RepID=UPI003B213436